MDQQMFQTTVLGLIQELQQETGRFRVQMDGMQEQISSVKKDILEMKKDILEMKEDILEVKEDILEVKEDIREIRTDIRELREDGRNDRRKLDEVYDSRHSVKIKFGWQWGAISLCIACVAAGLTEVVSVVIRN